MDATASREPLWDRACHIQAQMFEETAALGGLDVQLAYYRGFMDFSSTPWTRNAKDLLGHMTGLRCAAGQTQISRVLEHANNQARQQSINALVFVGDCMEEDPDTLCRLAGELGILNLPVFVFQDGHDGIAERTFREVARLSGVPGLDSTSTVPDSYATCCARSLFTQQAANRRWKISASGAGEWYSN